VSWEGEDRQLRRPYFRMRPCSRTSALYRSIWPASLDQLEEIFLRTSASCLLCANFTRRRHSAAWSRQRCALSMASMAPNNPSNVITPKFPDYVYFCKANGALRPCALHKSWGAHVSDGSKTEVAPLERHVRSTLKSRHRQVAPPCRFRATNGHGDPLATDLVDRTF
jgi:hypothetical protein